MSISIIGTGKVGSALAHVFARNHLEACAANTRGPESFPATSGRSGAYRASGGARRGLRV